MATSAISIVEETTARSRKIGTVQLIMLAIAVILGLQFHLVLTRSINWDEFYFYGQITDYLRGDTIKPIQTFHVQLFGWIPALAAIGVDGIIIGRIVMFVCQLATLASIGAIARRFVSREHAMLAVLIFLSAGYTIQHGWSFRTDPVATAAMMAALAIFTRARLNAITLCLAGVLVGIAGLVTVKAILLAPAFAGIAWLRWSEANFSAKRAMVIAAVPLVAAITFAALYFWHSSMLAPSDESAAMLSGDASASMLFAGPPIYLNYLSKGAALSLPLLALIVFAAPYLRESPHDERLALAGLALPLVSLLIYRNTLPYFYPMMLAPVVAGCAIGLIVLTRRLPVPFIAIVSLICGVILWATDGPSRIGSQREIQHAANEIFEEPVAYLDFPHMLTEFPKANGFLTRWGIEITRAQDGESAYRAILEAEPVPLLLTVDPEFNPNLLAVMEELPAADLFAQADRQLLVETYRPFWGPFWLAGKQVQAGDDSTYEVLVPGTYTITGGALNVNGNALQPGQTLVLDRSIALLTNTGSAPAGIIWGDNLTPPESAPPKRPYWTDF
ncbi:MAG: hypothetical protein ABJP48_10935 [Erythrobacter sp.]